MSDLTFAQNAWEEYLYWQTQDKKTLKKINSLLKDIIRHPFERGKARTAERRRWPLEQTYK